MVSKKSGDGSAQISLRLKPDVLRKIDAIIMERGYSTRQDFVRDAIRDALSREASP